MNKLLVFYLSLSILFPFLTILIRFRNLSESYFPLFLLLLVGVVNELVCYFFFSHNSSAIPTNIYFLLEALLLIWQFRNWKHVLQNKTRYTIIQVSLAILWFVDYIVLQNLDKYTLPFNLYASLLLVLLAVNQLNWLIINDRKNLIKNPIFLICNAVVIYFSYKIVAEVFYYYATEQSIKRNIFVIEVFVNVVFNILLFLAILCITPKKIFTKQLP